MAYFREGQEVEVRLEHDIEIKKHFEWRKAIIVQQDLVDISGRSCCLVQFRDGFGAIIDVDDIRAVETPGWTRPDIGWDGK